MCTWTQKANQSNVSKGSFFRTAVIPVSIIAQYWELNISQVRLLLFSHLSHQTIMLNFRVQKIFQALLQKGYRTVRDIYTCVHARLVFGDKRLALGQKCINESLQCADGNTLMQHRLQNGFALQRWVLAFCFLSCDCHPDVSFIKVIDVWCYHPQWHSKEG